MTETLPASVSTLLDSLISTLTTSSFGFNWGTADVDAFITGITASSLLLSELSAMQDVGWVYTIGLQDQSATQVGVKPPTTTLSSNYINGTVKPTYSKAANVIAVISYEAGHAEDPELNTINYSGTDLQYGAWIALDLLSEGKSQINNQTVQQQLGTANPIPVIGLSDPTTVFAAASSEDLVGQAASVGWVERSVTHRFFCNKLGKA